MESFEKEIEKKQKEIEEESYRKIFLDEITKDELKKGSDFTRNINNIDNKEYIFGAYPSGGQWSEFAIRMWSTLGLDIKYSQKQATLTKNQQAFTNGFISAKQNAEALKETFNDGYLEKLIELKDLICEYLRYQKLLYNCKLRRNEGYMINKSLADMRNDIKSLIMKSLKLDPSKQFLPLVYDKEIFPYCRDINIEDELYENFYVEQSDETKLGGELLKTMKNTYQINTDKINFVVFTVINTTDNGKVNNPPNPPYININNLIYYSNILKDEVKTKDEIKYILGRLKKYSFYNKNNELNNINIDILTSDQYIGVANNIINIIKGNNPSSLIGSIESTEILQNVTYDKVVCSRNEKLEYMLDKFDFQLKYDSNSINRFNTQTFGQSGGYYINKFIKYITKLKDMKKY
jgi:ribosomal protein L24